MIRNKKIEHGKMNAKIIQKEKYILMPNLFEKIVKEVFDTADKDHNGFIDKEELNLCIQQLIKSFFWIYS